MNLLPYRNVYFRSGYGASEVFNKLRAHIKPQTAITSGYWGKRNTREYEGNVKVNSFTAQRIIQYNNSFLPVIAGTFIEESNGTNISMKMRLSTVTLIGVCAFGGFAIVFFIAISVAAYFFSHINLVFLAPLGLMLFMYALTTIAFNLECKRSERDFKTFLEGL